MENNLQYTWTQNKDISAYRTVLKKSVLMWALKRGIRVVENCSGGHPCLFIWYSSPMCRKNEGIATKPVMETTIVLRFKFSAAVTRRSKSPEKQN